MRRIYTAACDHCRRTAANPGIVLRLHGQRLLCGACLLSAGPITEPLKAPEGYRIWSRVAAGAKVPWRMLVDAVAWRASTGQWVPLAQNQALVRELGAVAVREEA